MGDIHKIVRATIDDGLMRLDGVRGRSDGSETNKQLLNTVIRLHNQGKTTREEVIGNVKAVLIVGYDKTAANLIYIF